MRCSFLRCWSVWTPTWWLILGRYRPQESQPEQEYDYRENNAKRCPRIWRRDRYAPFPAMSRFPLLIPSVQILEQMMLDIQASQNEAEEAKTAVEAAQQELEDLKTKLNQTKVRTSLEEDPWDTALPDPQHSIHTMTISVGRTCTSWRRISSRNSAAWRIPKRTGWNGKGQGNQDESHRSGRL